MKKIDFTKIMCRPTLDSDEAVALNVAIALGNAIYARAETWEIVDLSRKIHDSIGEIELDDMEVNVVKAHIAVFPIWIRTEINQLLNV